jgi:hypothetical protein
MTGPAGSSPAGNIRSAPDDQLTRRSLSIHGAVCCGTFANTKSIAKIGVVLHRHGALYSPATIAQHTMALHIVLHSPYPW